MAPFEENDNVPVQSALINPNLRLPPEWNLLTCNVSENYKLWKRQIEIYHIASNKAKLPEEIQTATIINCGGGRLLKIYDHFKWVDSEDKNNPQNVFRKIEQYCDPRKNEVAESHNSGTPNTSNHLINSSWNYALNKAASCNFIDEDWMIRRKKVFSCSGKMQQLLLRDNGSDLEKKVLWASQPTVCGNEEGQSSQCT